MRTALKPTRFLAALIGLAVLTPLGPTRLAASPDVLRKLDRVLQARTRQPSGYSRVIVRTRPTTSVNGIGPLIRDAGGVSGRQLSTIESQVAVVPNAALRVLAASPLVERVSLDRTVVGAMERTGVTVGAVAVRQDLGVDGAGVGVAVIDSGITHWHDDLSDAGVGQRVVEFADFVDGIDDPSRRLRPRDARRRHHRGQWPRLGRRTNRHRTGCAPRRAEGARRNRSRLRQRRHCRDRLRGGPP